MFEIHFQPDYPSSPPRLVFDEKVVNVNLQLFYDGWQPSFGVKNLIFAFFSNLKEDEDEDDTCMMVEEEDESSVQDTN